MRRSNSAIKFLCCSDVSPSLRLVSLAARCLNDGSLKALMRCFSFVENGRALSRLRAAHAGGSSSRLVLNPGFRPGLCLPEGGGAPNDAGILKHLVKGADCRVSGSRAFRRSTAAICYAITVLLRSDRRASPLRSRQHLRRPSSDRVQPPKAGPSSGPDGDRASWDEGANPACRRRHPRSGQVSVEWATQLSFQRAWRGLGGAKPTDEFSKMMGFAALNPSCAGCITASYPARGATI